MTAETTPAWASMAPERRIAIARGLWAIAIGSTLAGVALAAWNGWPLGIQPWGIHTFAAVATSTLGVLVVSKRPTNPIGWMMLWMGLFDGLASFGLQYGFYGEVVRPGGLPAADLLGTVPYGLAVGVGFGWLITFFLLLFPDGRLPSERWRPVAWIAALGVALMTSGLTWHAASVGVPTLLDQLGAEGLVMGGTPALLNNVGHLLVFIVFPLAVASLFIRRRRADAIQRHQLRWFAYGAVVFLSSVFIPFPDPYGLWYETAAAVFLFVAIGIAVLRYRLYEIDRLVSRTVAYVMAVAVLAGVFISVVFLLGSVLPFEGELAAAVSTLTVAALFNPVRLRGLERVDRRFNRSRYDAAQTVETFSQRLRDEVDLGDLREELAMAAGATMQPSHLSPWLRDES